MAQEEEILGKAYDSRLMRRLLTYLRPYGWQVAIALVSILLKSFADVLGPYLTKVAIDRYLAPTKAGASGLWSWLSPRPLTGIAQIASIYVGLLLATFVFEFLQTYYMQWTGQKVMFDLRSQIFRHLQRLHVAFYDKNPVGRLVTRVTTDVDALNEMFTSGVVSIFEDVFVLVGIVGIMLCMNWKLALITFAVLPLIVLATRFFATACANRTGGYASPLPASTRICRSMSAAWWCCSYSTASAKPTTGFPKSTAVTWTLTKTRSWLMRSTIRRWKFALRSPLPRSSGSAAMTCCGA